MCLNLFASRTDSWSTSPITQIGGKFFSSVSFPPGRAKHCRVSPKPILTHMRHMNTHCMEPTMASVAFHFLRLVVHSTKNARLTRHHLIHRNITVLVSWGMIHDCPHGVGKPSIYLSTCQGTRTYIKRVQEVTFNRMWQGQIFPGLEFLAFSHPRMHCIIHGNLLHPCYYYYPCRHSYKRWLCRNKLTYQRNYCQKISGLRI